MTERQHRRSRHEEAGPQCRAPQGGDAAPAPLQLRPAPGVGTTQLHALMAAGGNQGMVQLSHGAGGAVQRRPAAKGTRHKGTAPRPSGAVRQKVQANALQPTTILGWFSGLQAPWNVALEAEIGLSWDARLAAIGVSLFARGTVSQDDDGRFRTAITVGVKGSAEFNIYIFAAKVAAQVSYTWGYAFQDATHFAARLHALIADYLKKIKKYLLLERRTEAARAIHGGTQGASAQGAAWQRLAATPPVEFQKAELQLAGTLKTAGGADKKKAIKAWLARRPKLVRQFMSGPSLELAYSGAVAYFYRRLDKARPGDDKKAQWQVKRAKLQSLAGTLEHEGIALTLTLQDIKNHANPDQDGLYLNIKLGQSRSADAAAPWNEVFSERNAARLLAALGKVVPGALATFENIGKAIDLVKKVIAGIQSLKNADKTTVGKERSKGIAFEAHAVYTGRPGHQAFEVQFMRVTKDAGGKIHVTTPGPMGSKLKIGVGLSGSVTLSETIGSQTLTYIKTAFDGYRNRGQSAADPRFTTPWRVFVSGKLTPVLGPLCANVNSKGAAYAEATADAMTELIGACKLRKDKGGDGAVISALETGLERQFVKTAKHPNANKVAEDRWHDLPKLSSAEAYKVMSDQAKLATLPGRQLVELLNLCLSRWIGSWRDQTPVLNVVTAARRSKQDAALISSVGFKRLYNGVSTSSLRKLTGILGDDLGARIDPGRKIAFIKELISTPTGSVANVWVIWNIKAALLSLSKQNSAQAIFKLGSTRVYYRLGWPRFKLVAAAVKAHSGVAFTEANRPQLRR